MDVAAAIASRLRRWWLQARGIHFEGSAWLRAIEVPKNHARIRIGAGTAIDRGCTLLVLECGQLILGPQCYINRHTFIACSDRLEIGARAMVGPFCFITDHDHVSGAAQGGELIAEPTRIGEDCWIGAHVTILKGVTIGTGTTVGAGSVVTKSLPPNVVAVGNPARIIRTIS